MEKPNQQVHLVNLGGTTYALRYTFGAFALTAGELGIQLTPLGRAPFYMQTDSWYQLCVMLYIGLRGKVPGLTLGWISERVTPQNMPALDAAVTAAFTDFFREWLPEEEREAVETMLAALPSNQVGTSNTGGDSGPSGESGSG